MTVKLKVDDTDVLNGTIFIATVLKITNMTNDLIRNVAELLPNDNGVVELSTNYSIGVKEALLSLYGDFESWYPNHMNTVYHRSNEYRTKWTNQLKVDILDKPSIPTLTKMDALLFSNIILLRTLLANVHNANITGGVYHTLWKDMWFIKQKMNPNSTLSGEEPYILNVHKKMIHEMLGLPSDTEPDPNWEIHV